MVGGELQLGDVWPLARLRVRLGSRLELVVPDEPTLLALGRAADEIFTGPDPFNRSWTDGAALDRARNTVRHQWRQRAEWTPQKWSLPFAVVHDGQVVGAQDLSADDFGVTREVRTGSWLNLHHHGRGIGTAMRVAVLSVAFEHLDALSATSGAYEDNPASRRVSQKVGYGDDGVRVVVRRGRRVVERRFRLDRSRWTDRGDEVTVDGLDACRDWFGGPGASPVG